MIGAFISIKDLEMEEELPVEATMRKFIGKIFTQLMADTDIEKHIMEPLMDVLVTSPSDYSGDVIADLNSRGGFLVKAINPAFGEKEEIKVVMPLKKMFDIPQY